RSNGQEKAAARLAVSPNDFCFGAGGLDLLQQSKHLAHSVALVSDRKCSILRRARVSVADSDAREEEGHPKRDCAELHPIQLGSDNRPNRCWIGIFRFGRCGVFPIERCFISGSDLFTVFFQESGNSLRKPHELGGRVAYRSSVCQWPTGSPSPELSSI